MKNNKTNKVNVDELINKAAKEAAKETLQELKNSNYIKNNLSYFRKVELILLNYKMLKDAVNQKDEDIEYIEKHGLPQKSGSIVIYQTGGGNMSSQERYIQLIEKYKLEKLETEREIRRIDNALDKVKKDKYYKIIEFKYLNSEDHVTDDQIAEELSVDQSTITRNRKRLINSLKTILFPESIKEFA
ncbi:hypothetical protein [Clostridium magnum]|uniref:Uncharacterized protein n=1 Tax=Clostridium magnum DSM 2767 TaxID=1121326 RepID=A0A162UWB8_9CLOT|nr:hypothetical protein [Clostridium magnum]KZL94355.1 hypothetical protein CLMAG_14080 [Clostridium magnum DSM 2767]SHJ52286.1 hypothetical protein SAMN02745944_06102 [Clostridium magnum DSM 2767]